MPKKFISRPGILLFSLSIILFSEIFRFKGILSVPLLRDTEKKRMGGYALASILILAIGDVASGIAQAVKREHSESIEGYKRRTKPPEVILVMFGVSL
jgi:hypothetical protein